MFLLCNNMPLIIRNILVGLLGIIGIILGVYVNFYIGLILVIAACVFVWKKTNNIGPKDFRNPKWETVGEDAIKKVDEKLKEVKKIKKNRLHPICLVPVLFAVWFVLYSVSPDNSGYILVYIGILFYSIFCTGGNNVYRPDKLFKSVSQQGNIHIEAPWTLERQMEITDNTPIDYKSMLKKTDMPKEFLGIQVQTGINNGPNGECLYTYCVILAKKEFNLVNKIMPLAKTMKEKGIIVEDGSKKNEDVSVVVIRKDGYETNEKTVHKIINYSVNLVNQI